MANRKQEPQPKILEINTDTFIELEFDHLEGWRYYDTVGTALYSSSQMGAIMKDLAENGYSNPHSNNIQSKLCGDTVDQIRCRILQFFNTTTKEYDVIFTSGASQAFKLVAENFDFSREGDNTLTCGDFFYLEDNHTPVIGMKNVHNISCKDVSVICLKEHDVLECIKKAKNDPTGVNCTASGNSLLVFPAQSHFSGKKYPLDWIEKVHNGVLECKYNKSTRLKWFCLLDATTYVSTSPLDLSAVRPDFVVIEFDKMFGFPTGLGALLVLNSSGSVLRKHYFGGGTVQIALASRPLHVLRPVLHERFEDGTLDFLSIISLGHGFDFWQRIGLDMQKTKTSCFNLAKEAYRKLGSMLHSNGQPVIHLYTATSYDDPNTQGAVVNFNVLRDTGQHVGYVEVLNQAKRYKLHLGISCFCNPAAYSLINITEIDYYRHLKETHMCREEKDLINGQPTGSVRISFGPYNREGDVDVLMTMIVDCFVTKPVLFG